MTQCITSYQAKYFAHSLTRRLPANDGAKFTATLQDARVDLTPHQIDAALFAFKSPLSKGAILADEVGLGKTILKSFKERYSHDLDDAAYLELRNRLKPVCKRTLRRQVLEYIRYTKRIAILEEFYPTADEQALYELVSDYLQRPTLYALPNSQRQLMTMILRKLLASSTYAIYGTFCTLIDRLKLVLKKNNTVFANRFISTIYVLNSRKVPTWIL